MGETNAGARYRAMHEQLTALVGRLVSVKFGTQHRLDQRPPFLVDLEVGRIDARVELNALTRILVDVLHVPSEVWVQYLDEELAAELARLQQELGDSPS